MAIPRPKKEDTYLHASGKPKILTDNLRLTATDVQQFRDCQYKFWYLKLWRGDLVFADAFRDKKDLTYYNLRGTFLHKVIELFLEEYKKGYLPWNYLYNLLLDEAKGKYFERSFIEDGQDFLRSFHQFFIEEEQYPLHDYLLEEKLSLRVNLHGIQFRLVGRTDALNYRKGQVDILDWKFRNVYEEESEYKQQAKAYQLGIYALLLPGENVGDLARCVVTPQEVILEKTANDAIAENIDLILYDLAFKIQSQRHHPELWECGEGVQCKRCPAKKEGVCPVVNGISESPKNSEGLRAWNYYLMKYC